MAYGGLPQVVLFQSERQKVDYLKNIFANVYLKDVVYNELLKRGYNVDVGIVDAYGKDKDGKNYHCEWLKKTMEK